MSNPESNGLKGAIVPNGSWWRGLCRTGYPLAHRSGPVGPTDIGDVLGLDRVVEVKSAKTLRLGPWLDELDVEKANAGMSRGVLIVRRPGWPDPGEWFAVQRCRDYFA